MAALFLVLCFGSLAAAEKDFYVKPSVPSADCPSGETPCHTLQEYADQHAFITNNSRFVFLEGEHHLDTSVEVRNVHNLSLVGAGYGVKILGSSPRVSLNIEQFTGVIIERVGLSNLNISLASGSDMNLSCLETSSWVRLESVAGTISITNSTFTGSDRTVVVLVDNCQKHSQLSFVSNYLNGPMLDLSLSCSGVQTTITDCKFESGNSQGLSVDFGSSPNNSMLVESSEFADARIFVQRFCSSDCQSSFMTFSDVTTINSSLRFSGSHVDILIENFVTSFVSIQIQLSFRRTGKGLNGRVTFQNVTVSNSDISNIYRSIIMMDNARLCLSDSTFENNAKTALQARNTEIIFKNQNTFRNNSGLIGGAIQMIGNSSMHLSANAYVLFEKNHAEYVGGAIFVRRSVQNACPFVADSLVAAKVDFVGNTASRGGSSVYGFGNDISLCNTTIYTDVFNISNTESNPSAITSDPFELCFCGNGKRYPDCSTTKKNHETYAFPGQEFPIRLAAVSAELEGVVPADISAYSVSPLKALNEGSFFRASSKFFCEDFNYSVKTTENVTTFNITTNLYYTLTKSPASPEPLSVTVLLMDCPLGFSLSNTTGTCVCDSVFDGTDVQCLINNQSFLRPTGAWIGAGESLDDPGVIYHPNCPIGYCLSHDVSFTSNASDSQCESHRTGLLCGQCQDGYSLTLGDGRCKKCSNTYLLLILPLAVAGLLLVAVLFALNLTVTEGTINGLIFYANVVAMTHNILFSRQTSYLYTFVAWLNLDLGISTCLYNGLDAYTETWIQLVFPVYLWAIVLAVIQLYNKYPRRLPGKNAVQVLATLFLLSYTKLQRIVVTIMSFTTLEYSSGRVQYVWQYDANVDYFKGKHLYLGIAAILILVFVIVPYTLLLVFFQQLQALSDRKFLRWVNKLKPVFDAYSGGYQDKFRFWTGMLLVVRTLLIILFTINTTGSADVNLLIILIVCFTLLMCHSNAIYKKRAFNYLERIFYLQLGVFAAGIGYTQHSNGNVTAMADISFGLALIVFLAIVGYHVWCRFPSFKMLRFQRKDYVVLDDQPINHDNE